MMLKGFPNRAGVVIVDLEYFAGREYTTSEMNSLAYIGDRYFECVI